MTIPAIQRRDIGYAEVEASVREERAVQLVCHQHLDPAPVRRVLAKLRENFAGKGKIDRVQARRMLDYAVARIEEGVADRDLDSVVDAFHRLFYRSATTWRLASWRGLPMMKAPTDLLVYHELIYGHRPDLIIETGTAYGASALFLADTLDIAGVEGGRVVSVELSNDYPPVPEHPRLSLLRGSSIAPGVVTTMRALASTARQVMVILDSNHSYAHVAAELAAYAPLVTPGSWLIVEDTNLNREIVHHSGEVVPGPHDAVDEFVAAHPEFVPALGCEHFLLTFNPGGFLQRRIG